LECGDSSPLFIRGVGSAASGRAGSPQPAVAEPITGAARRGYRALPAGPWLLCFCFLLSAFCFCAHAQYSLNWSTIDGGGGTSTGDVYSVSGTIGQPDAATMSGGGFTLNGGFWGIIAAIQTPGTPLLSIISTGPNTLTISWPSPSAGWILQHNSDLKTTNWGTPPQVVSDNGTEKFIIVSPATGNRFYRLIRQ
jgi:hypothetical protein